MEFLPRRTVNPNEVINKIAGGFARVRELISCHPMTGAERCQSHLRHDYPSIL